MIKLDDKELKTSMKALGCAIIIQACVDLVTKKKTKDSPGNPKRLLNKYIKANAKEAKEFLTSYRLPLYCRYFGVDGIHSPKIDRRKIKRELEKVTLQRLGFVKTSYTRAV
jgi:hypothetical protein